MACGASFKITKKMKEITFYHEFADSVTNPKPSLLSVPKAFKGLEKRIKGKINQSTVKACIPFLDAYTIGYHIFLPYEVCFIVEKENGKKTLRFITNEQTQLNKLVSTHGNDQVPPELRNKKRTFETTLKFMNYWKMKTPSGYSCLITQPHNRPDLPFEIITGVVDTDTYDLNINFPFYWTDDSIGKEIVITTDMPIAQIIPFKREEWKMKVENQPVPTVRQRLKFFRRINDNYLKHIWNKKSYK